MNSTNNYFKPALKFFNHCINIKPYKSKKECITSFFLPFLIPVIFTFLSVYSLLLLTYHLAKGDFQKAAQDLGCFLAYALLAPVSPILAFANTLVRSTFSLIHLSKSAFSKSKASYVKKRSTDISKKYDYSESAGIVIKKTKTSACRFFHKKTQAPANPEPSTSAVKFKLF